MPTWTTSFGVPPATTGLVATADPETSSIVLTWDPTTLAAALFWRYYIYRKNTEGVYERVGEVASVAPATYADTEAPHGVPAEYLVTTSNGFAEGQPDADETILSLGWWIVHPADPALTFELRYVDTFSEAWPYRQEEFNPLGRTHPLVVSEVQVAPSGQLHLNILPKDRAIYYLLRRAAAYDPWVVLKSPFGDVYRVKLGDMGREVGTVGLRPVTVSYRTVA